jgi:hypothetical protein
MAIEHATSAERCHDATRRRCRWVWVALLRTMTWSGAVPVHASLSRGCGFWTTTPKAREGQARTYTCGEGVCSARVRWASGPARRSAPGSRSNPICIASAIP